MNVICKELYKKSQGHWPPKKDNYLVYIQGIHKDDALEVNAKGV
jgi:hypothetical protein